VQNANPFSPVLIQAATRFARAWLGLTEMLNALAVAAKLLVLL
jgi:hypothetical protein